MNRRAQNLHSPLWFLLRPQDGSASLPLDVSQGHSVGPRSHTQSVLLHPVPAIPPFTTHFLRSLFLCLDRSPKRSSPLCLFDHTFPGTFSLNQSLQHRPHFSLLPWPETPPDKRLLSAYRTQTARGAAGSAHLRPAAALTSLRPSHLSGTRGPNSPDCVMESSGSFHQPRPTSLPRADP